MTPSGSKIHAPVVVLLGFLLAACGPARPPPDVTGQAERDLAKAREAGAATFAPMELRFAEEKLDAAHAAMQEREFEDAALLADESAANSELAETKARIGKTREAVTELKRKNAEISKAIGADSLPSGEGR